MISVVISSRSYRQLTELNLSLSHDELGRLWNMQQKSDANAHVDVYCNQQSGKIVSYFGQLNLFKSKAFVDFHFHIKAAAIIKLKNQSYCSESISDAVANLGGLSASSALVRQLIVQCHSATVQFSSAFECGVNIVNIPLAD